jgi:hypothetical protein
MLRAIRPEAGEEPKVLRLAEGCQQRRSADASLLVVGVLKNPSEPEAGNVSFRIFRLTAFNISSGEVF